jgi:hypothetical protein
MAAKITRLALKSLWNSEYTIFVNQVINIITKYLPEKLHLLKAFNKLTAFIPHMAKIKAQELSNAISKQLSLLDSERDILFNAIGAQIKALGKVNLPSIAPHVLVLKNFMNIHGDDIASAPYNAETKRLNDLLADYNAKANVKLAAETLNIKILFDQLATVNTTFANQFMLRTEEISAVEKVETRTIRTEIDKTLKEFFDAFEFCSREYDELDYATPANEINELTNYYNTQLKARTTRRKTGKDVSEEPPIVAPK